MMMRVAIAAAVLLLAVAVSAHRPIDRIGSDDVDSEFAMRQEFQDFQTTYGITYATQAEANYRYGIFRDNLSKLPALRKANPKATFGVNKFFDRSTAEFKRSHLNYVPPTPSGQSKPVTQPKHKKGTAAAPPTSDWRNDKRVTPVKDQGQCGSCWAFSATEQVETAFVEAGGEQTILAPQQVVDCDTVDQGCNGGDTTTAYAYIEQQGLALEVDYPYTSGTTGATGTCNTTAQANPVQGTKVASFTYATPGCTDACTNQNELLLAQNIQSTGPASICVYAEIWQTYTGGILSDPSTCPSSYTTLDHCVQLVGLASDSTGTYWIIRNSWNTNWGNAGYIYVEYGQNVCGVADEATYVKLA